LFEFPAAIGHRLLRRASPAVPYGLPPYETANHLTDDKFFDPLSGQQAYKCFAYRVRKA
jgi:hypothetical protein